MTRTPALLLVLAVLGCLLLATCDDSADYSTSTPRDSTSAPLSRTPSSATPSRAALSVTPGTELTEARVTKVVDGDTIRVDIDGVDYPLRYIGINTPETHDPSRGVQCFGPEASDFNEQLVLGQTVGLEKDVRDVDDFGRLLRYVWLGDEMVNATLVREGFAESATYPPDIKYQDLFRELMEDARLDGAGFWSGVCAQSSTATTPPSAEGACVIKGNISSDGEKIYHVPGQENYDITQINEAKGERWFCTEEEAVAAGWRKALR